MNILGSKQQSFRRVGIAPERVTLPFARTLGRALLGDIFVGPDDRVQRLPQEPILFLANHTWCLDGLITLLLSSHLSREYSVIASARVARIYRGIKDYLGIIPMSKDHLENIRVLRNLVDKCPSNSAIWMFPQAVWIPQFWDVRDTVTELVEKTVKMLKRSIAVVPVHIELITVRTLRTTVVFTIGELIQPTQGWSERVAESLEKLRAESASRLSSHCSEYRSILHEDGYIFCGYPIRLRKIERVLQRKANLLQFNLKPIENGWTVEYTCSPLIHQGYVNAMFSDLLPGVLWTTFKKHLTIEVQQ
jgi:hypothetical protein